MLLVNIPVNAVPRNFPESKLFYPKKRLETDAICRKYLHDHLHDSLADRFLVVLGSEAGRGNFHVRGGASIGGDASELNRGNCAISENATVVGARTNGCV